VDRKRSWYHENGIDFSVRPWLSDIGLERRFSDFPVRLVFAIVFCYLSIDFFFFVGYYFEVGVNWESESWIRVISSS